MSSPGKGFCGAPKVVHPSSEGAMVLVGLVFSYESVEHYQYIRPR
jgi:hypothetical protein